MSTFWKWTIVIIIALGSAVGLYFYSIVPSDSGNESSVITITRRLPSGSEQANETIDTSLNNMDEEINSLEQFINDASVNILEDDLKKF